MEMQLEIEEEYKRFLEEIKDNSFTSSQYMEIAEYKGKYSYKSIGEAMRMLQKRIKTYLQKYRPKEFALYSDLSIHVIKKEKAAEIGMMEMEIAYRIVR